MKQKNGIFITYLSLLKMVHMILMEFMVMKASKQLDFSITIQEILTEAGGAAIFTYDLNLYVYSG